MEFWVKKLISKGWHRVVRSESGQAVIEYVLILTVMVGVILGGLYQLNDAFRVFADSYFGDYWACLLETGELPSLGGGRSGGECETLFRPFNLADGRQLIKDNGDGGGSDTDSENQNKDSSKSDSDSGTNVASGGGNAEGSPGYASGAEGFGSSGARRFRATGRSARPGEEDEKNGQLGSAAVTNLTGAQSSGSMIRIPLRSRGPIRGAYEDEDDREKRQVVTGMVDKKESEKSGPQRIKVDRQISTANADADLSGFSFGQFLRWLIIAGIIIAIVIFIGGQLMQVSKSMD